MEQPKIDLKVLEEAWKREVPVAEEDIKSQLWRVSADMREIDIEFKNDEKNPDLILVSLKERGTDRTSEAVACMSMASILVSLKGRGTSVTAFNPESAYLRWYQYSIIPTKPVYQEVADELKWLQQVFQICNEIRFLYIEISEQTTRKYRFSGR